MKTVVFGMLGTNLDRRGGGQARWNSWRPTVALCQHEDLLVDRFELLYSRRHQALADQVTKDIRTASPETEVSHRHLELADPWDFAGVYGAMREFTDSYRFEPEHERYLVHVTTGTHVVQICWFLLTEARDIPGCLLQTSPPSKRPAAGELPIGQYQEIDLDLTKYDQIAQRFAKEHLEGTAYLKQGIETRNVQFNAMIAQLEKVSIRSDEPILLMGPTGAGKSQLAQLVYALKQQRGQFDGRFVAVNCATLRGDAVSSTLFGHVKGSFTGATTDRPGLLREADDGLLFLDEVGELGLEEQAMLLSALESKRFFPFGSDKEVGSNFQLVAGTNRELWKMVDAGEFREDLLARLDLWTYNMPSLRERLEDIEPNVEFEVRQAGERLGAKVRFSREARARYLRFATSEALWRANFRDLNSSIKRMATLAEGGRISIDVVEEEIALLKRRWDRSLTNTRLDRVLGPEGVRQLDLFDRAQLTEVVAVCQRSVSLAAAGRELFQSSRLQKASTNDSHRLKQYLARFNLTFAAVRETRFYQRDKTPRIRRRATSRRPTRSCVGQMNREPRTVVLDIGGVLMQLGGMATLRSWTGLDAATLKSKWLSSPDVIAFETGQTNFEMFAPKVIEAFSLPVTSEELLAEMQTWMSEPYASSAQLLEALAQRGPVAFLCNLNEVMWPIVKATLNPRQWSESIFLSCRIGFAKPHPRAYDYVSTALDVDPASICFFDDSYDNVVGARACGWQSWHVEGVDEVREALRDAALL